MSDQENFTPDEETEDVEAHRRKSTLAADDGEPKDDKQDEDDVELHGKRNKLL